MHRHLTATFVFVCVTATAAAQQQVKHIATFVSHDEPVRAVAFSPDCKLLASGSNDQSIILWDLAQGKPRAVLEGHRTSIWNLVFSPDGQLLASGIGQPDGKRKSGWDFSIKLWDVKTGKLRRNLEGCTSNVFSMAFSPNGKYLAACHNFSSDNVKLWDVASGKLLGNPTRGYWGAVGFSNDSKLLAVAGKDKSVELWDLTNGECKAKLTLSIDVTGGVSFSPDDKLLAVGTTNSITLCDLAASKEIRRLKEAIYFPTQVLFSPDSKHVVAANADWCSVSMWDVQTGKEQVRFRYAPILTATPGADGVAFSRDGALVASADRDCKVTIWRNPLSKLPLPVVKSGAIKVPKFAAKMPRPTSKERNADFDWFSTLSLLDTKAHPLVKVYTNNFVMRFGVEFSSNADESKGSAEATPYEQQTVHGFLLEKKGNRFTILTPELARRAFETDPKAKKERVRFEPADLKTYAKAVLKGLRAPPKKEDDWKRDRGPSALEVFVLAWACARQGLDVLATDLYQAAAELPTAGDLLSTPPLRGVLAEELAGVALQSIASDMSRQEVPLAAILQTLLDWTKRLPALADHDDVRALLPLMRRMVQEDAEHAKNARPFAELSQREQIAELIFQLRDQGGYVAPSHFVQRLETFQDPVDHRIDHDPWPNAPKTAAQQLVKLGVVAAGPLIDHLDDERLTRSLARDVDSMNEVLRIGDCAVLILERISGRKFKGGNRLPADTKRRIRAWHAELQKKGEKQTLIDGVRRGDEESYEQALRLIARYAEEALLPIEAGLKAAKEDETRHWLLRAAGRLKGSDALLRAELTDGPSLSGRLESGKILHRLGRPEAVHGMLALWNNQLLQKQAGTDRGALMAEVADTLIATQQSAAIDGVARSVKQRPVGVRQAVANSCGQVLAPWNGDFFNPKRVESKASPRVRVALEQILFSLLDDTEENSNWTPATRTCDRAAAAFNDISATLYPFNEGAPIEERDRAIRQIKRTWQKMHEAEK